MGDIMATMATPMEVTTMERDLLRLTRGTDTMDTDMVLDTMDTVLGTMVASTVTTATTARDLLSLLLPLMLRPRLIPICCTEDTTAMVLDIMATMATPMDMSTESKSNARTEENEVPTFLTTTCQMFSTSEKNQNTKHPHSSNKLHLNIYTF